MTADSRRQHATLAAKVRRDDDGTLLVLAPCVGRFREGPGVGSRVQPGQVLGVLEVLGKRLVVHAPHDARGTVVKDDAAAVCQPTRRAPVSCGHVLRRLDPRIWSDDSAWKLCEKRGGRAAARCGMAGEHESQRRVFHATFYKRTVKREGGRRSGAVATLQSA